MCRGDLLHVRQCGEVVQGLRSVAPLCPPESWLPKQLFLVSLHLTAFPRQSVPNCFIGVLAIEEKHQNSGQFVGTEIVSLLIVTGLLFKGPRYNAWQSHTYF